MAKHVADAQHLLLSPGLHHGDFQLAPLDAVLAQNLLLYYLH